MEVVDRDLERVLGRRDEVGERVRGLFCALAAVGQCPDVDQVVLAARSDALYARFAAW